MKFHASYPFIFGHLLGGPLKHPTKITMASGPTLSNSGSSNDGFPQAALSADLASARLNVRAKSHEANVKARFFDRAPLGLLGGSCQLVSG